MKQKICLANLKKKTAQEVFDYISEHLLKQKKQAFLGRGITSDCAYQNKKGLRCAAGCLIAPSEYRRKFEGKSWQILVELGFVPSAHEELILRLQSIHDTYKPFEWREQLALVNPKHWPPGIVGVVK